MRRCRSTASASSGCGPRSTASAHRCRSPRPASTEVGLGSRGEDLLAAAARSGRRGASVAARPRWHDPRSRAAPGGCRVRADRPIDGGVLVVRADESIERYDAAGKLHGRIVPEAGERIGSIAARAGNAAALIATPGRLNLRDAFTVERRRPAAPIVARATTHAMDRAARRAALGHDRFAGTPVFRRRSRSSPIIAASR